MPGLFDDIPSAGGGLDPRARDLAIRTIYGEASGEPDEGMAGVAHVIRNRLNAGKFGGSVPEVVLAKGQFEPWERRRAELISLKQNDPAYQRIGGIVDQTFAGGEDPTGGATHFYAPEAQAALGRPPPSWARGEPRTIGRHAFYLPPAPIGGAPDRGGGIDVSSQAVRPGRPTGLFDDIPAAAGRPNYNPRREGGREGVTGSVNPVGGGEALGRGAMQGFTAGFYDELRALAQAGGSKPEELTDLPSLIRGAWSYAKGDPAARTAYDEAVRNERARQAQAREEHPYLSVGGEIAGAVVNPAARVGTVARGATWGARAAGAARGGAAYGAAAGAGEGEDLASRVTGAATGGAVGAAFGPAATAAGSVIGLTARGVGAVAAPAVRAVRGFADTEGEAARRVARSYTRAQDQAAARGGQPGGTLTRAELDAARAEGRPVTNLDMTGEQGRALARSARNTSEEAATALREATEERFISQSPRTAQFLDRLTTGNGRVTLEQIQQRAAQANRPAYEAAYAQGRAAVNADYNAFWTPELRRLARAPSIRDAMLSIGKQEGDRSVLAGFQGARINPFARGDNGQVTLGTLKSGRPVAPDLEAWDSVTRKLRDQIGAAQRSGRNEEARNLTRARNQLLNELDGIVPSFNAARGTAFRGFRAEDAFEAGQNYVTMTASGRQARELAQTIGNLSGTDRVLFMHGFASSLIARVRGISDNQDVVRQIFNSPAARERIQQALGPNRARELEAYLRVERIMNMGRTAVSGNSTTAAQLIGAGLAGGTGYSLLTGQGPTDPGTLVSAALAAGGRKGFQAIDQKVARRVGEMLASHDPDVFARGLQAVARNSRLMNALRSSEGAVAGRSGAEGSQLVAPTLQPGRAENDQPDQPEAPRPIHH